MISLDQEYSWNFLFTYGILMAPSMATYYKLAVPSVKIGYLGIAGYKTRHKRDGIAEVVPGTDEDFLTGVTYSIPETFNWDDLDWLEVGYKRIIALRVYEVFISYTEGEKLITTTARIELTPAQDLQTQMMVLWDKNPRVTQMKVNRLENYYMYVSPETPGDDYNTHNKRKEITNE